MVNFDLVFLNIIIYKHEIQYIQAVVRVQAIWTCLQLRINFIRLTLRCSLACFFQPFGLFHLNNLAAFCEAVDVLFKLVLVNRQRRCSNRLASHAVHKPASIAHTIFGQPFKRLPLKYSKLKFVLPKDV